MSDKQSKSCTSLMDSSSAEDSSSSPASADAATPGKAGTAAGAAADEKSHGRRGGGLLVNLRKGYKVFRRLLAPERLSSRLPYKSPRFADPVGSWRLAIDWLSRLTQRLSISELLAPVFDRHGWFDRLEPRRLLPAAELSAIAATGTHEAKKQQQLQLQQLQDRILQLTCSGDLLRALSARLLEGGSGCADGGNCGDSGCKGRQLPAAPRRDLLQLPLTYETAAGHQHQHPQQHHHYLNLPLHLHHHRHQYSQLRPQAQAGINCCEKNFAAFHRFMARVLTCPGGADDEAGDWELRIALGKQCAECNAVCMLLHSQHQLLHQHLQQQGRSKKSQQQQQQQQGGVDSALSVLLLHLLTLMLLLNEPMPNKQRAEILLLWEDKLQPSALAETPNVKEVQRRYAELMRD